jgi:hypothetical protein
MLEREAAREQRYLPQINNFGSLAVKKTTSNARMPEIRMENDCWKPLQKK